MPQHAHMNAFSPGLLLLMLVTVIDQRNCNEWFSLHPSGIMGVNVTALSAVLHLQLDSC